MSDGQNITSAKIYQAVRANHPEWAEAEERGEVFLMAWISPKRPDIAAAIAAEELILLDRPRWQEEQRRLAILDTFLGPIFRPGNRLRIYPRPTPTTNDHKDTN